MERKDDEHISGRTLKGEKDMVVRRTVSAAFTWEQFKEILAAGNAKETFGRKGEIDIQIEGIGTVAMQILDYDKDKPAVSGISHTMTLCVRDLVFDPEPFGDNNKWEESTLREKLNSEEFINRFEEAFRNLIIPVERENTSGVTTIDKVSLLSLDEIKDPEKKYAFFETEKDCIKVTEDGKTWPHRLRSAHRGAAITPGVSTQMATPTTATRSTRIVPPRLSQSAFNHLIAPATHGAGGYMFKNGMKILCRDQKDFDEISELAEKEGKKWPKPQIPRKVRENEIISIDGNYMQHANKDDHIYDSKEVIESSELLKHSNSEKIRSWYQYDSVQGMGIILGITPQMIRDYHECARRSEKVGVFPDCDKCSWGRLIIRDSYMCAHKETPKAIKEAERNHASREETHS